MQLPKGGLEVAILTEHLSWDTFLGGPYNIAQYAMLMHLMGHVVNMVPGDLTISSGDTHIYQNHFDAVEEQMLREPLPLPKLRISSVQKDDPKDYEWEDLSLIGYQHLPPIRGEIAV